MEIIDRQFVFSQEEKERIYDLYVNQGYSGRALQREFNCSQKPMTRVLNELGIDHSRGNLTSYKKYYTNGLYDKQVEDRIIKQMKLIPSVQQKYNISDKYFDNIFSPEVVYTIGFLYADGCNHDCSHISMALEEKDGYILEQINNNIGNENPIKYKDMSNKHDFGYDYENQYQLDVYNKRIGEVLNLLGVVPRKSLVLEFPKWLRPDLYSVFIKGVYDGDGSLYRYIKDGKARNTVCTITSTENFCKALCDVVAEHVGIRGHIYDASCHNGVTKVFSICGYDVCKKFLDWLYSIDTICLQRKYDRYCDYYNINNSLLA